MISFSAAGRIWLGSLFLYSSSLKLANYEESRGAVARYEVLPGGLASAAGTMLPWVESIAGAFLLFDPAGAVGPFLAASLGTSFSFGAVTALRRRTDVPCGCAGNQRDRVGRATAIRAAAMVASSGLLFLHRGSARSRCQVKTTAFVAAASFLPAAASVYGRAEQNRRHKARAENSRQLVDRMTRLLAADPAGPVTAGTTTPRREPDASVRSHMLVGD